MKYSCFLLFICGLQNIHYCLGHCSGQLDYSCGVASTPECIPIAWRCDNIKDCSNGKDEVNCNYVFCPSNTFKCKSRECLSPSVKCDGNQDCADGSDEAYCNLQSSSPTHNDHANKQRDSEQGEEISLDSPVPIFQTTVRSPTNEGEVFSFKEEGCVSRHLPQLLNFTGTYMDDGGYRLYVAVNGQTNKRKVFFLEEAFDKDAWSLVQYLAAKLK